MRFTLVYNNSFFLVVRNIHPWLIMLTNYLNYEPMALQEIIMGHGSNSMILLPHFDCSGDHTSFEAAGGPTNATVLAFGELTRS